MTPFIEKCYCFVLPSWHGDVVNTNLESVASGRPIITSNIHSCLEAVVENKSGILVKKKERGKFIYSYEKMLTFYMKIE